jgi:hypothetical protein
MFRPSDSAQCLLTSQIYNNFTAAHVPYYMCNARLQEVHISGAALASTLPILHRTITYDDIYLCTCVTENLRMGSVPPSISSTITTHIDNQPVEQVRHQLLAELLIICGS